MKIIKINKLLKNIEEDEITTEILNNNPPGEEYAPGDNRVPQTLGSIQKRRQLPLKRKIKKCKKKAH